MKKNRFRKVKQQKITANRVEEKNNEPKYITKRDFFKIFLTDTFMLLMPIMYIVFYIVFGSREAFKENMLLGWIYILIPLAIVEILFLSIKGQTPGMKAYNAKLISLEDNKKPSTLTIIIRQLLSKITFLIFGWITIFFNKKSRNLHDFITKTAFVYDEEQK
ncbi:MAG: RDD family protein [Epsilonproteobacteria bacterium]|nr:RDD family protein [Campylobacterota bacterium]